MRSFLALEIPDEVKQEIKHVSDRLLRSDAKIRQVPADNYHVTIYFAGTCDDAQMKRLLHVAQTTCSKAGDLLPLALRLGTIGTFTTRSKRSGTSSRTLWIGLEPNPDLEAVYRFLLEELRLAGFAEPNGRRFLPHITLARQVPPRALRKERPKLHPIAWESGGPALFESRFLPGGVTYRILWKPGNP